MSVTVCRRPQGGKHAMKLGGKKDVESFVDQLKSEGERMCTVCIHSFLRIVCQSAVFGSLFCEVLRAAVFTG